MLLLPALAFGVAFAFDVRQYRKALAAVALLVVMLPMALVFRGSEFTPWPVVDTRIIATITPIPFVLVGIDGSTPNGAPALTPSASAAKSLGVEAGKNSERQCLLNKVDLFKATIDGWSTGFFAPETRLVLGAGSPPPFAYTTPRTQFGEPQTREPFQPRPCENSRSGIAYSPSSTFLTLFVGFGLLSVAAYGLLWFAVGKHVIRAVPHSSVEATAFIVPLVLFTDRTEWPIFAVLVALFLKASQELPSASKRNSMQPNSRFFPQ